MTIAVVGANGRVGRRVAEIARKRNYTVIEIDTDTPNIASDMSIDAVIDFSAPDGTVTAAAVAIKHNAPLICGTTGLDEAAEKALAQAKETVQVVYSENFSKGISALNEIAKLIRAKLGDWDCEIAEIHRKGKRDAPSGTAKAMANELSVSPSAVHSLRCGSVLGTHTVIFASDGESITITHNAENVDIFANGALSAAEEIYEKQIKIPQI